MLRIGMIGADNFHALAFSRLANLPPEEGGSGLPARVTMLWGESAQRAAFVANEAHIHTVVDDPARMLGQVDAVMVVLRHGAQHHDAALPFLRAGISTWVDKLSPPTSARPPLWWPPRGRAARCWRAAPRANTARMCFGCGTNTAPCARSAA